MSRILAIDTHQATVTRWTGVEDGRAVDPQQHEGRNRHDRVLADGVAAWLHSHPDWRDSVDAIAVIVGPGGFTGLRVGVALATGLAAAKGWPVLPVETGRLLAARGAGERVWALTRAGGNDVRGQVVKMDGSRFVELTRPDVFDPGSVWDASAVQAPVCGGRSLHSLLVSDEPVVPLGEGYDRARSTVDRLLGSRRREAGVRPWSEALAAAVESAWQDGRADTPLNVDVDYGADFQPTPKPGG